MDDLRVTRREDDALILTNDLGEEFRLIVDEVAQSEFRQLSRRTTSTVKVRPREIQALLRAGKSRAEVAEEAGVEESDVARFEEPVRAEQRYILEIAHAVSVRTDPDHISDEKDSEQRFGEVIVERLASLGSSEHVWRSWKDEVTGWHVGLEFMTMDQIHDAVWGFDHRKHVLTPLSPDATHLSKSGAVGDQLIPKLRAVGGETSDRSDANRDQFSAEAFDGDSQDAGTDSEPVRDNVDVSGHPGASTGVSAGDDKQTAEETHANADDEYERRREIDQLAINKPDESEGDLSQTADLLDALRRRRGERANQLDLPIDGDPAEPSFTDAVLGEHSLNTARPSAATNIWGANGVSADDHDDAPQKTGLRAVPATPGDADEPACQPSNADSNDDAAEDKSHAQEKIEAEQEALRGTRASRRGRSSIPSWDDILFGTRSEDDPV